MKLYYYTTVCWRCSTKIFGGQCPPKKRGAEGRRMNGPKAPIGAGHIKWCHLHSRLEGVGGRYVVTRPGPGRRPGRKCRLFWRFGVFSRSQDVPVALICQCFEIVKQWFVSPLGASTRFGAIVFPAHRRTTPDNATRSVCLSIVLGQNRLSDENGKATMGCGSVYVHTFIVSKCCVRISGNVG